MTRLCSRDGCWVPANRTSGSQLWSRLCPAHNKERIARREASKARVKCACGNETPMGLDSCRRCIDKAESDLNLDHFMVDELQSRLRKCLSDGSITNDPEGVAKLIAATIDDLEHLR